LSVDSLRLLDPDVAVLHGIAVVLQQQAGSLTFLLVHRTAGDLRQFEMVVNNGAVVKWTWPN
jgi:hypothetical protein